MAKRLENRNAIVTGAARGIGQAICEHPDIEEKFTELFG